MGQFFFAWVDKTETTFDPSHHRSDEQVFAFEISHSETEFPGLELKIRNPRVGLLSVGRSQWAWLSWERGPGDVVPLFFGRLLGIPQDLQEEIVTLSFVARPSDFEEQKEALAAALRVLPYWDPIWFNEDERMNPDHVLDARTQVWHIDRVSPVVSVSDIIVGEDGTETFTVADHFYDAFRIDHGLSPARKMVVEAEVTWDQTALGRVDLSKQIGEAFGSGGRMIRTLTGAGLERSWPKKGAGIGGGWTVGTSDVKVSTMYAPMYGQAVAIANALGRRFFGLSALLAQHGAQVMGGQEWHIQNEWKFVLQVPLWEMWPTFMVDYAASRGRSERMRFALTADVQPLLTDPGAEEIIYTSFGRANVSELVDQAESEGTEESTEPQLVAPILDVRRRAYFTTDRGKQSLDHLIARARAQLLARARAVNVTFGVRFADAVGFSCRQNALVFDPRCPGGQAGGKIVRYFLSLDGDSGALLAGATIACCVGKGNTISPEPGQPTYVENSYVESGYQVYAGLEIMPFAGEVVYQEYAGTPPNDDGIDFFNLAPESIIQSITARNVTTYNAKLVDWQDPIKVIENINQSFAQIRLVLKPVDGGPYHTDYLPVLSDLMVPKTIDLESE